MKLELSYLANENPDQGAKEQTKEKESQENTWRNGFSFGRLKGKLESDRMAVVEALEVRFGRIPKSLIESIQHLKFEKLLRQLHRRAIMVDSLETFTREVPE